MCSRLRAGQARIWTTPATVSQVIGRLARNSPSAYAVTPGDDNDTTFALRQVTAGSSTCVPLNTFGSPELGAARLIPVMTQRTVAERVKLERLEAIAIEAAEQCGRTRLPAIAEPVSLAQLLAARDAERRLYFADEGGGEAAATAFRPGPALILTGPEGGFAEDERMLIRAAPNAIPISLGPRILRAETAALAALAVWMAGAGDWRA